MAVGAALLTLSVNPGARAQGQTRLCYFAPGRSDLDPRCEAILTDFAAYWSRMHRGEEHRFPDGPTLWPATTLAVEIAGHLDRAEAGTLAGILDGRRAEVVAAFLAGHGIPAEFIRVTFHGAARPLVPSEIAEPLNRPVEIVARSAPP